MRGNDFQHAVVMLLCVGAVAGWAAIETLLWLLSHIKISWGG